MTPNQRQEEISKAYLHAVAASRARRIRPPPAGSEAVPDGAGSVGEVTRSSRSTTECSRSIVVPRPVTRTPRPDPLRPRIAAIIATR